MSLSNFSLKYELLKKYLLNLCSYISIIDKEGLEVSQPALDTSKSEVHHQITARGRKGDVHRSRMCNFVSSILKCP